MSRHTLHFRDSSRRVLFDSIRSERDSFGTRLVEVRSSLGHRYRRLTIAPKDHRNDAISVYLEVGVLSFVLCILTRRFAQSVNGQLGEPFLIDAHFTLSIAAGGATLCVQALRTCLITRRRHSTPPSLFV